MKKWFRERPSVFRAATVLLVLGLIVAGSGTTNAQIFRRAPCPPCPPCPCPPSAPSAETGVAPMPAEPGTGAPVTQPPITQPGPEADLFAQNLGAPSGPASVAPNMIGDFFGTSGVFVGDPFNPPPPPYFYGIVPLPGNAIPRFKMAENTSPLPQDRLYFDYSYYHNVSITDPAIDVDAYVPGFEKTFLDGLMSFEMRLPMADTLNNNLIYNGPNATADGEVGNLGMALKAILLQNRRLTFSGGLAMTVPTAKDTRTFVDQGDSVPEFIIRNDSVHLMPFVGALWTPNRRWFAIGYLQVDVDVNGDRVSVDSGQSLRTSIGRYREPTVMYLDGMLGYWAYRSHCPNEWITGIAPVFEVHVNQGLEHAPVLIEPDGVLQIGGDINGSPVHTLSIVDLTVGLHVELCRKTTLTAGYCTPATGDRQFDGQFRLFVNRRF